MNDMMSSFSDTNCEFIFETLNEHFETNPKDLLYFGIGTFPRIQKIEQFTKDVDQIIPLFLDKEIKTTKNTIRILLIDPAFDTCMPFLHKYFDNSPYNFYYDNSSQFNIWISSDFRIEIIVISMHMRNTGSIGWQYNQVNTENIRKIHDDFINKLCTISVNNKNKLIIQDYSGAETSTLFKRLYEISSRKSEFKNNILFDITYGDAHCSIDLINEEPIYDPSGNFINLMLMSVDELRPLFNYHPKVKKTVSDYYIKEYSKVKDQIPVDIRRKLLIESGNSNMGFNFLKYPYTLDSSFETILEILKQELNKIIPILIETGIMSVEKQNYIYSELLNNFNEYKVISTANPKNIYIWCSNFSIK